ncbi:MAG: FHA domain-containing protein [Planctomycetia bacterium]|nr:FHA domain-containing protein [Planctomycetia bacterium]
MRAQLIPVDGSAAIVIVKDLTVVGRKDDCDIKLDHKSVSKQHCAIVRSDGMLMLRDLGSTNGTRVNGTRVRRAALLPNDQLTISHFQFRVAMGPDPVVDQPAGPHEHTVAIDGAEFERILQARALEKPKREMMQRNQLPDSYE